VISGADKKRPIGDTNLTLFLGNICTNTEVELQTGESTSFKDYYMFSYIRNSVYSKKQGKLQTLRDPIHES